MAAHCDSKHELRMQQGLLGEPRVLRVEYGLAKSRLSVAETNQNGDFLDTFFRFQVGCFQGFFLTECDFEIFVYLKPSLFSKNLFGTTTLVPSQ